MGGDWQESLAAFGYLTQGKQSRLMKARNSNHAGTPVEACCDAVSGPRYCFSDHQFCGSCA